MTGQEIVITILLGGLVWGGILVVEIAGQQTWSRWAYRGARLLRTRTTSSGDITDSAPNELVRSVSTDTQGLGPVLHELSPHEYLLRVQVVPLSVAGRFEAARLWTPLVGRVRIDPSLQTIEMKVFASTGTLIFGILLVLLAILRLAITGSGETLVIGLSLLCATGFLMLWVLAKFMVNGFWEDVTSGSE